MEKESAYMQRQIDWKRVWMLFSKKIWLVLVSIFIGALVGGLTCKLVDIIKDKGQFYCVSSDYYITFTEGENGVDYYNAYTWDTILRDDPVVDVVMENLPVDFSREEVKAAITGEMIGDYRILTVYAKSLDPQFAVTVADAYEIGLAKFADKLDMLDSIELWSQEEVAPVVENDYVVNVALFGSAAGFILSLLLLAFFYILDDSIYIENDFAARFNIPFLGIITKAGSEYAMQELKDNLAYFCKEGGNYYLVAWDNCIDTKDMDTLIELSPAVKGMLSVQGEDLNTLRKSDGVVIVLPWGGRNGRIADKLVTFLKKQNCNIAGAVLTNADDTFLKTYYLGKVKRK